MSRSRGEVCIKEIHEFNTFHPKLSPLGLGVIKFTIVLSPYATDATYHLKISLVVLENMLTDTR